MLKISGSVSSTLMHSALQNIGTLLLGVAGGELLASYRPELLIVGGVPPLTWSYVANSLEADPSVLSCFPK